MSIAEYIEWYILYIPASVYGWGLTAYRLREDTAELRSVVVRRGNC